MQPGEWCQVFVNERPQSLGLHEVQFQFSRFTLSLDVSDLSFAQRILTFVEDTKDNPEFRDLPLGGGAYRYMPEKSIDLSSCFPASRFVFSKLGEGDSSYNVEVAREPGLCLRFGMNGEQLDEFVASLRDVVDEYVPRNFRAKPAGPGTDAAS